MSDVSLSVKAKILAHLDSDATVTVLVPASSIFPMQVFSDQTFPFVRYGEPTVRPFEDWCGRGATVETTLHCFAEDETTAQKIAAVVQESLSRLSGVMDYEWVRTQFRQDPDEDSVWQGMVTVVVTDRA